MLNLLGEHICRLDDKGRMLFPSKLKKQLEQVIHHGLVMNRDIFSKCLVLYPKPEWDKVQQEMSKLSRYSKKHQKFQRIFMNGATTLELDLQGRINLPFVLLPHAEIDLKKNNEVVLVASNEKIEMWSRENYTKEVTGAEEDIEALAEEVRKDIEKNNS
ncbi:MAG: division/cell wall cluster transcriptional repressor MraZ [Flavobacteriales bacterium]|nr:division/cell wall cluster transcriptional repressor MraZ [Flavobacteriales bacterium]